MLSNEIDDSGGTRLSRGENVDIHPLAAIASERQLFPEKGVAELQFFFVDPTVFLELAFELKEWRWLRDARFDKEVRKQKVAALRGFKDIHPPHVFDVDLGCGRIEQKVHGRRWSRVEDT